MSEKRKIMVHESEIEGTKKDPPRVSKTLLSEFTVGAKQISMGCNITEPGSKIPLHKHDENEEAMFLVSGKAKLIMGGEEYDLVPGTAFFSPLGVEHEVINTGDEPFKIIWAYAPPLADHLKK
jgi:putative monooxygenase